MADRQSTRKQGTKFCYRHGSPSHVAPACCHLETVCKSCGKKGHLAAVCQSKPHKSTPSTQTKYMEDGSDSDTCPYSFQSLHPSNQGLCELGGSGGYDGSGHSSRCVTDVSRAMVWSAAPSSDGIVKLHDERESQCRSHTHEPEGNTTTCHS